MAKFFAKGLAVSTQRSYKSAQKRFLTFCKDGNFRPIPASEAVLCRFVSYLADQKLKYRTIKTYLAGIRFMHIAEGQEDPFKPSLHRLQYSLAGIKRSECERSEEKRERLLITPSVLRQIKSVWEKSAADPDIIMLWAACCLGFFCFLRSAQMTVPSDTSYDPSVHLSYGDILIDNPASPTILQVSIKQSKTDPFRKGISLFLGKTSANLCPVTAMLNYLIVRGNRSGPLFIFRNGQYLTRERLVTALRTALKSVGLDESKYCSHSFRIGAATTAASKGIEDSIIKTLGRWRSLAYLEYVRIPRQQLAFYSRVLCS